MRSALIAAAFAASVIAVPYQKRDVVTDTDVEVVYATEIVTVTAAAPSTSDVVADEDAASSTSLSLRRHRYTYHQTTSSKSTSTPTPSSIRVSSTTAASVSTTATSTSAAAPVSTKASSTSAAAPVSTKATSTSIAAASTSTKATSTSVAAVSTSTKASSTSAAVASTSAAATSAAASAKPSTYAQIAVYHHNIHRANHSAVNIAWDDGVAATAASIAASCVYAHNVTAGGGGYGQNIAAGVQANNISAIITDLFYNGEVGWFNGLYGAAQPDMTNFEHWGHFSQIVWKDTTHVGCATQDCSATGLANVGSNVAPYFTVCNYVNPGNYANEYGANIGSPLNYPTAEWNAGL